MVMRMRRSLSETAVSQYKHKKNFKFHLKGHVIFTSCYWTQNEHLICLVTAVLPRSSLTSASVRSLYIKTPSAVLKITKYYYVPPHAEIWLRSAALAH